MAFEPAGKPSQPLPIRTGTEPLGVRGAATSAGRTRTCGRSSTGSVLACSSRIPIVSAPWCVRSSASRSRPRPPRSINQRLMAIGGEPHHPSRLLELGEDSLRSVGLSGAKARYVLNLAEAVASGQVPLDAFDDSWDDAAIIQSLTAVKGIGVWTAEMFLIFVLNRPDVLPAGDLGVRAGLRDRHGLAELPAPRECHALAEHWRPYRSIASWYIWRANADTRDRSSSDRSSPSTVKASIALRWTDMKFDLILKGGWVIDGTGGRRFAPTWRCSTR